MGVLRFLLALSVLLSHGEISELSIFSGNFAVEVFFCISGFYMAMVLDGRYTSVKSFYTSRFLRIFPAYLLIMLAGMGLFFVMGKSATWEVASFSTLLLAAIANLTLIGQDVSLFLEILPTEGGILAWTHDFTQSEVPFFNLMLIPTAWSLSMEIYFYLLVPWLVKLSDKTLMLILLGSGILRVVAFAAGYNTGGWVFRFFPFEVMFFVGGILLFRYREMICEWSRRFLDSIWGWWVICVFLILYGGWLDSLLFNRASYLLVFLFIFMVPVLFELTKKNRIDRFIGEFSYPMYLAHPLFFFYFHMGVVETLIYTLIVSVLIVTLLEKPVDAFRHRFFVNKAK